MSEELLIRYCSPTLARIKTGSLVNCRYESLGKLKKEITRYNIKLNSKGVSICLLRYSPDRALIYVYRPEMLREDLFSPENYRFMRLLGYTAETTDEFIAQLSAKLKERADFPHEIGMFLGYPLEDVKGFIVNKGRNSKYCGCWKVYGDVEEALKNFGRYKKCTSVYHKNYTEGLSINRLTVANI